MVALSSPVSAFASELSNIPENNFGVQSNNEAIHFNPSIPTGRTGYISQSHTDMPIHFNPEVVATQGASAPSAMFGNTHTSARNFSGHSGFAEGEHIGSLTIHRLNRTINVFEGATMRNMDFGAGRFDFSGINSGNTSLIGHNRGRNNGFFSFVRTLQEGDLITLDINGMARTYAVTHSFIVSETDFTPFMEFGHNRLTLVTCVEYRPRYRRIAVAVEI